MDSSKEQEQQAAIGHQEALSDLINDPEGTLERDNGSSEAPIKNDTTFKSLQQRYNDQTMLLSASKTYRQILDVAYTLFDKPRDLKISNIICLGLGSLSGAVGRCCCCPTTPEAEVKANTEAMGQLVYLEEWIKQCRKHFELPDTKIYFQDPMFNALDREFITSLGYTVIISPTSSWILNNETFLFAPWLEEVPLYISLKQCFPAIYMGNSLTGKNPWSITSNTDFREFIRPFVEGCREVLQISFSANSEDEKGSGKLAAVYYPLSDMDKAEQTKFKMS